MRAFIALLALGILVRLVLAWVFGSIVTDFPTAYDHRSYELVAAIMERGGNVYAETYRYNYSPVWAFVLLGCSWVASWLGAPLAFVVRALLTLVDVANAGLIARLAADGHGSWRRRWVPAFGVAFLNPASVILTGTHGQFENLAALPLLAAVCLATRVRPARAVLVWGLGAIALVVKHIWIFGVWTLFVYAAGSLRRAVLLMISSLAVMALTFVPYLRDGIDGILRNVVLYRSNPELYGLRALLPQSLGGPVAVALFVEALPIVPFLCRRLRVSLPRALAISSIALLVLIPGVGFQYFAVPVIVGALYAGVGFWTYSIAASAFMVLGLAGALPPDTSLWQVPWLAALFWLALEARSVRSALRRPQQHRDAWPVLAWLQRLQPSPAP